MFFIVNEAERQMVKMNCLKKALYISIYAQYKDHESWMRLTVQSPNYYYGLLTMFFQGRE